MKHTLLTFSILLLIAPCFGQKRHTLFEAGFKCIISADTSRIYKPNTTSKDKLHYRPVELDIWYPSAEDGRQRLMFGDLLKLFEQRATMYQDMEDYAGMADELAQQIAMESGLEASSGKRLLNLPTGSYKRLKPFDVKQPLIVYFSGYNGMGFENYSLLESLAKKGFVVVSIWSVGRYPGNMTTDKEDMLEQVYDAEYAVELLRKREDLKIDFNKIGVLGCSWGGISAAIFANRNKVDVMATLDGSENYVSGDNVEEDNNLKEIFDSIPLFPQQQEFTYLCLKSDIPASGKHSYFEIISAEKYYARVLNTGHPDFLCLQSILTTSDSVRKRYEMIMEISQNFFEASFKGKGNFRRYYSSLPGTVSKLLPYTKAPLAKTELITATVVDEESGTALSLVNVGIVDKETGTVTSSSGRFQLNVSTGNLSDSIRVSIVGYKAQSYSISDLLKNKDLVIRLTREPARLQKVVIAARKLKKHTIGNTTTSRFISTPFTYHQLGAEIGTKLNIKRSRVLVDSFNFHVAHNRLRNRAWFRLNIYEIQKGFPSKNIVGQNILIPVDRMQTGKISVDLKPYRIILNHDIIVTLEWVKNEGIPEKGEAIYFSLGLFTKGTFVKPSSQAKMKKHGSMGVGFNMDVRY